MKQKLSLLTTAAVVAAASQASAQGLLSIGRNLDRDFERKTPFTYTVGAQVGWDSNVTMVENNEQDSAFLSAIFGVEYANGDRRTAYSFNADYSPLWYFDAPVGIDDYQHNIHVGFNFRRRINPKMTVTNSFYLAHETSPNFDIGASYSFRTDPYTYGFNSIALAYAWNRRFSTVTSYTIHGVVYDGPGNDYLTHIFANEFRYAMSRTTTAAFSYRYSIADFDISVSDYDSHHLLVGFDHRFNPQTSGSIRVGAEIRDGDTNPYAEAALNYRVSRKTDLRWFAVYGLQTNGSGGNDQESLRTGLTAVHRFNRRVSGSLALHYVTNETDGLFGDEQEIFAFSAGFDYALFKNVSLNGGYSFTTSLEDNPFDRHQLRFGVASRF